MVKSVLLHLDDDEYELMKEIKGKQSWREFILLLVNKLKEERKIEI